MACLSNNIELDVLVSIPSHDVDSLQQYVSILGTHASYQSSVIPYVLGLTFTSMSTCAYEYDLDSCEPGSQC